MLLKEEDTHMSAAWTYLLVCSEGLTYLGSTSNLKRRLHAHNSDNNSGWTKGRKWRLLAAKRFETRQEAFAYEALLKVDVRRRNAWKRKSTARAKIVFARHGIEFDFAKWAPKKRQRVLPAPRPDYWSQQNGR
ncbi:GIY-YIG nuclease family protein [Burkholderia sp. BCC1630]|uniref:GIY-YIG nuclease family protein n=1 Tax=Burkholderia sp. BCC1630 TaxID=2676304 RepID=UPI00158D4D29|nr:GIY-YIG nuclease family protein [Burkholderia sp. BCC1630]